MRTEPKFGWTTLALAKTTRWSAVVAAVASGVFGLALPAPALGGAIMEWAVSNAGAGGAPTAPGDPFVPISLYGDGFHDSFTVGFQPPGPPPGFCPPDLIIDCGPPPAMEMRAAFEFPVPSLPAGATFVSAELKLTYSDASFLEPVIVNPLQLHGYAGDGLVDMADMDVSNLVFGPFIPDFAIWTHDVSGFVGALMAAGESHAGFMLRMEPPPISFVEWFELDVWSRTASNPAYQPRLLVYYSEPGSGGPTGGGTAPEPATLALVGLALAGLGFSKRKRS